MGFVRPIRRRRAWRPAAYFAAPIAVLLGITAYPLTKLDSLREPGRPQRAGQALNPYVAAAHIAVARADALVGDTRAAQAHVNALAHDLARSARVPDTTRPINHEAARAAVQPLPGVRSAIWLETPDDQTCSCDRSVPARLNDEPGTKTENGNATPRNKELSAKIRNSKGAFFSDSHQIMFAPNA